MLARMQQNRNPSTLWWEIPLKPKIELPYDPMITLLGIFQKEYNSQDTIETLAHQCLLQDCSQ
jgi:hypothetical protein